MILAIEEAFAWRHDDCSLTFANRQDSDLPLNSGMFGAGIRWL
jgi:hypothetical protein